jgi:hypothetical protein
MLKLRRAGAKSAEKKEDEDEEFDHGGTRMGEKQATL